MDEKYRDLIIKYKHIPLLERMVDPLKTDLKLLKENDDLDWYLSLSPERTNILQSFPWNPDMEVLEIGLSRGVFAPFSLRVKSWTFEDDKKDGKEYISERFPALKKQGKFIFLPKYQNLDNDINNDPKNILNEKSDLYTPGEVIEKSDLYTPGKVIEKADLYSPGEIPKDPDPPSAGSLKKKYDVILISLIEDPVESFSALIGGLLKRLKKDGSIIILADNAGALKYMVGARPAKSGTTLSKKDFEKIREKLGLKGMKLFYPLPDANFTESIFSDERLPGSGDFRGISEGPYEGRFIFCREENLYSKINEAGSFSYLCPSYFCVLSNNEAILNSLPIYAKYNSMRVAKYALKTEIFKDKVVKTALSEASDDFVADFKKREEILNKEAGSRFRLAGATIGKESSGRKYASFPLIKGIDLSKKLSLSIKNGLAPKEELKKATELLLGPEENECHNLDLLFENLIEEEDGKHVLIDYEWAEDKPIPRLFLKFRMLKYWYDAHRGLLTAYKDAGEFYTEMGFDAATVSEYEKKELTFQENIRGELKELKDHFNKDQHYVWDIQDELNKIPALESEVDALKVAISKERETERLSQNHIRNIEAINKIQKDELKSQSSKIAYLLRHQSLFSKISRRAIDSLDRWAPQGSKRRAYIHLLKRIALHPFSSIRALLNGEERVLFLGEIEIGQEFLKGGILKIPEVLPSDFLSVSIIIPAYNQLAYTYSCIKSIIENTDFNEIPYEIILADDNSNDATEHIERYIKGLIISRNAHNLGFLKNCNQAAGKGKGKYIFFLNNDTKVYKKTLSLLVSLLESDESIGMTGSKLIYPDGRLQEAGGIIWQDGSGWNYGRYDDPEKPEYNYVKEVDYISGAAIMLRKELWDEIGGFDERYAPAYCEDSDLAFEVRRHGKKVVYEPQSKVTHFEGISNGTDTLGTGLKHYQVENTEKFKEKWAHELKAQAINTGDPNPFIARDRTYQKPCLVVIDHYVPTWDKDAGGRTTFQYLKMFVKKGFNVKFIGDNFIRSEPYTSILQQMGIEVLYGGDYQSNIREWFRKNREFIKICYLNRPHIAVKYIDFLKSELKLKCIFYGHDLHFLRLHRAYELTGDMEKLKESMYWKAIELSVMDSADAVYYPSKAEIDVIKELRPSLHAKAINAYLWDEFPDRKVSLEDVKKREGLLFVGGTAHPPNKDGLLWFLKEVFPLISRGIPNVKLTVVGNGTDEDEDIKKLCEEMKDSGGFEKTVSPGNFCNDKLLGSVQLLGSVSDEKLISLYRESRVSVVPLRYGAGVKGKVIEALYYGLPLITTKVGAEGIPEAESVMVVADMESQDFAREVISLYKDPERCASLIKESGIYIKKHYSMESAWDIIKEDFT